MISDNNPYYGQGIAAVIWQRGYDGLSFISYIDTADELRWFQEGEAARKLADAPVVIPAPSEKNVALALRIEQEENRRFEAAGIWFLGWHGSDYAKQAGYTSEIRYEGKEQQRAWTLWKVRADAARSDAAKAPQRLREIEGAEIARVVRQLIVDGVVEHNLSDSTDTDDEHFQGEAEELAYLEASISTSRFRLAAAARVKVREASDV